MDGDLTLCESRAIIQYAFNKYAPKSNIYPADPAARAKIDSLLYYDQGTFYKTVSKYIYNSLGIRFILTSTSWFTNLAYLQIRQAK